MACLHVATKWFLPEHSEIFHSLPSFFPNPCEIMQGRSCHALSLSPSALLFPAPFLSLSLWATAVTSLTRTVPSISPPVFHLFLPCMCCMCMLPTIYFIGLKRKHMRSTPTSLCVQPREIVRAWLSPPQPSPVIAQDGVVADSTPAVSESLSGRASKTRTNESGEGEGGRREGRRGGRGARIRIPGPDGQQKALRVPGPPGLVQAAVRVRVSRAGGRDRGGKYAELCAWVSTCTTTLT